MTIDERLERLTERHEALAQTVDVLATSAMRHERAMERLEGIAEQNGILMAQLLEITANLGIKIGSHEQRLNALERPN